MKNLRKFPTPIKLFACIAISLVLVFLTAIFMLPFAFAYDFDNCTWEYMHYAFGAMYFIATIYWAFFTKERR
tara:strand:+ start:436 stop:651 length:216 start_codon:yes stop_codon:yes gene_type:complete